MADFPSKVTTETSSPNSQSSQQGSNRLRGLAGNVTTMMDIVFLRSIISILMCSEIIIGLLHWALIASANYTLVPAYGWVMFVSVSLWILTTILFFMLLFGAQRKLSAVPWLLAVMVYNGIASVLYLSAFLTNAATVNRFYTYSENIGAAAFFSAVVTLIYATSAFFSYLDWKDDGGNAATSTVPT